MLAKGRGQGGSIMRVVGNAEDEDDGEDTSDEDAHDEEDGFELTPTVVIPAAPVPRNVRLSASTSRAGGVSAAKVIVRTGNRLPHCPRWAQIDMNKPRARIKPEPKEPDLPRGCLKRHGIVVRHCDIERRAVEVFRTGGAANGAIVLWASIGRPDDQRLAQPVAQRLQGVERLGRSFSTR